MKKNLLSIIMLFAVMPVFAQISVFSVYGTYKGDTQIGINNANEIATDKKRPSEITVVKTEKIDRVNINFSGFNIGKYTFKKLVLNGLSFVNTAEECTLTTSEAIYTDAELTDEKNTLSAHISIEPGAKGTIKGGILEMDMVINFKDSKLYTHFSGKMTTTTGIDKKEHENNAKEVIYDITGKKVSQARKGLYIINGKKVMIK